MSATLKLLKESNLIQQRTGAIMLNPKLAHRGKDTKEKYLLTKFDMFEEDTK
ncbi:replication/maintenance protein RepL [Faecalibacillus intestinalis]|uniref:replication/maintenance protein RepL n=1 Tax=Faecalibacillus intestinalis TaxID=1982626 RepID=UPI001EE0B599|nr:replication/maintenance protein RepL [Faecalibacillus intestinalis]MCG4715493.1 replication/maintenance protein RepL [Faecalibacillus intestinalis]